MTFLPFKEYEQNEVKIRDIKKRYPFLDCYFVKDYPENHLNHFITLFDKTEWLYLFSTDRKKNPKGFVKINF